MRNKFDTTCHYCQKECPPGTADVWKAGWKWLGCCDECLASNPKQIERKEKLAKKQKKQVAVADTVESLENMSEAELRQAVEALMANGEAPEGIPSRPRPPHQRQQKKANKGFIPRKPE